VLSADLIPEVTRRRRWIDYASAEELKKLKKTITEMNSLESKPERIPFPKVLKSYSKEIEEQAVEFAKKLGPIRVSLPQYWHSRVQPP
jgi:hypothetical protein